MATETPVTVGSLRHATANASPRMSMLIQGTDGKQYVAERVESVIVDGKPTLQIVVREVGK